MLSVETRFIRGGKAAWKFHAAISKVEKNIVILWKWPCQFSVCMNTHLNVAWVHWTGSFPSTFQSMQVFHKDMHAHTTYAVPLTGVQGGGFNRVGPRIWLYTRSYSWFRATLRTWWESSWLQHSHLLPRLSQHFVKLPSQRNKVIRLKHSECLPCPPLDDGRLSIL